MNRSAVAVQHVAFEDLGLLEPVLHDYGYDLHSVQAGIDDLVDPIRTADLTVVLGGPIGANDDRHYPFLAAELAALSNRADLRLPTLGICLGAQPLARALGAKVAPSGRSEIGYAPLKLTDKGLASPLRHLVDVPVLHWHNDSFEIPPGADHLASTSLGNQAFALGPHLLGLQFHVETPTADLERWLIGHAEALNILGIDPRDLRAGAAQARATLEPASVATIIDWLAGLRL